MGDTMEIEEIDNLHRYLSYLDDKIQKSKQPKNPGRYRLNNSSKTDNLQYLIGYIDCYRPEEDDKLVKSYLMNRYGDKFVYQDDAFTGHCSLYRKIPLG